MTVADSSALPPASTQTVTRLADYRPPLYRLPSVSLTFWLDRQKTTVEARIRLERDEAVYRPGESLLLHGGKLALESLTLEGEPLMEGRDYRLVPDGLELLNPPVAGELVSRVSIDPSANLELEGLYASGDMLCTQCEAEGFRKITYWLDRPDLLSVYTVKLIASAADYPVLLANGNCIEHGTMPGGQHFAVWHDPFPKPAYLFAVVAGQLVKTADRFTTRSGRTVDLEIWTRAADAAKTGHAMMSLKHSMAWDEQVFGLEYDLDIYMIVAVGDFNMGAMENKGLNVFNTKYVLADPQTATDLDYQGIEAVIAHEYFHNWTGNRVTCRDWFQLSLKEGLTVFRDQQFSADMNSAAVQRIGNVRGLRAVQFPEDAGPTAHPVRPDSYVEINNFYTATVYNKGAEVVRMYHTLLGADGFRRGMDLYFQRHDGQAVTCDDFRAAMADANGVDLSQFGRWYSQAGTPVVRVTDQYDTETKTYTLTMTQSCPPTPGQPVKEPFLIPIAMGLLSADGQTLPTQLTGEATAQAGTRVLRLSDVRQSFTFVNVAEAPIPSLLRGFSAPVKLERAWTDAELATLAAHDSDAFARWEAGQTVLTRVLLADADPASIGPARTDLPETVANLVAATLAPFTGETVGAGADPAFAALCLALPGEAYLAELVPVVYPDRLHAARNALRTAIGRRYADDLLKIIARFTDTGPFQPTAEAAGRRALRNTALDLLVAGGNSAAIALAADQAKAAGNMTDRLAALTALVDTDHPERSAILEAFQADFAEDALVLDKWFTVQALSRRADTLAQVTALLGHPAYDAKNPNKVRALVGSFTTGNRAQFHALDGSGYGFLADQVIATDGFNGKLAARLVAPLAPWKKMDPARQGLMRAELDRIRKTPGLSKDVTEIVEKALAA
ncbi:aminopeptidase N [Elstera cyanobacteriorum]|uniref:Aminopeptidase N n=1 Tax=Elstera cyanobacteriorum TaxID=2022747 RepID=A0A255XJB5_9PROT|nr:aminopeptidase N [Elstera cyanobacteriorum]OYQ17057.1 aminopeptidase N [Elstera cyanobacteriorum]